MISGNGDVRGRKEITLFISNEDMDDIFKIVESLEKSGLLIDNYCDYDGTYNCLINSTYRFFNYKCYILKRNRRKRRWIYSIISIVFNDKGFGKKNMDKPF